MMERVRTVGRPTHEPAYLSNMNVRLSGIRNDIARVCAPSWSASSTSRYVYPKAN